MAEYECMIVFDAEISEEEKGKVLEKIKEIIAAGNGELKKNEDWGKRALAYPIRKRREGIYNLCQFSTPDTSSGGRLIINLEKNLVLNERILRYLTVQI